MLTRLRLRSARTLGALCAAACLTQPALAQDVVADGFAPTGLQATPVLFGSYATLSTGERVVFDGLSVDLYDAAGAFVASLGALPGFVFNAFVEVDPTETFAVIGESSNGDLFKVQLDGSALTPLANLPNCYDAAFEPSGALLVSASTCGFLPGCANDVARVDTTTGATTFLVSVAGPSGPLAVSPAGDLYYATIDISVADNTRLLRWSEAQLGGGALLTEADAVELAGGLAGASSLAVDPEFGNLLLAETVFGGTSRVLEFDPTGQLVEVVVESGLWLGNLELLRGPGIGHFHRYQPAEGVFLHYSRSDFVSVEEIATVRPQRPTASFAQAGSVATVSVTGGAPNGAMLLVFAKDDFYVPGYLTTMLGGSDFQFHAAAPLNRLRRSGPLLLPLDANGAGDFHYFDPGNLAGTLVFQALVADGAGRFVGSSTAVLN